MLMIIFSGTIVRRLLWDCVLFLSVFWMPPLLTFFFATVLLFFFSGFYEFLVAALFLDALYGAPTPLFGEFQLVFSFAALFLFALSETAKRRMRFY